ncbi:MAG: putative TonB-dependent receptor BfrD [Paracidovorax wautersii]|uniref:Putative TonB-dependent receptor BfrD n=1 Tax=Paracidovorax wautersii TaxID=1177982 RepID=A0A7V8FSV3_9BURK|nr:MAG: putative TonB-dependent receptor BfrD [Paracidovorax wautersii]
MGLENDETPDRRGRSTQPQPCLRTSPAKIFFMTTPTPPARARLARLAAVHPLALAACFALGGVSLGAQAQTPPEAGLAATARDYDIAPGPLGPALSALAGQAGVTLSFTPAQTQGLATPGLRGRYTVEQGFERLLAGTPLAVRRGAAGYTLGPRAAAAPAAPGPAGATLGEVRVTAAAGGDDTAYNTVRSSGATKTATALRDVPQTMDVVPQQVIRDQGATSMQDVLRNVAGVGLNHGDGQRDQVSIRGFTSIGDQFVDGFRDDAMYFRDLSNIERVEVIKGPAAVLYGRGSSGGLVNRVTKQPGLDVTDVALSVGSWAAKRGEFDVGRVASEQWSWRMTGAVEDGNSYRSQQFLKRQTVSPSVRWQPSAATSLTLQADWLHDERVTDFGVPATRGRPVNVDPSTYYGSANARDADTSTSRVSSLTATFNHRFSDSLRLRNALRYYRYTLDRQNTLPAGTTNDAAGTVALTRSGVDRFEHGVFNQTELVQTLRTGGLQHEILYGVELGQQNKDALSYSDGTVATVSVWNPVLPVVPLDGGGPLTGSALNRYLTRGLYVQDQVTLSPQWKVLAGLRYDRFGQRTDNRMPGKSDFSRNDATWSPRAGVVWQPSRTQSYYASVSRSYQPSAEMFALTAANAALKPERTTNYEVGAKLDWLDGALSTTASLFQLERTDIKTTDPAAPTQLIPVGTQRTRGLELSATGELRPGTQAWLSYAFLDTRITQSTATDAGQPVQGKRATLTPRHSLSLWLTQAVGGDWTVGGGASYVGDRFANPGNTVTLPSYVVFDAMVQRRLGRATTLQLNLRNLLDRRYIVSGHGTSPNLNLPGAPRNATLTLRHSF